MINTSQIQIPKIEDLTSDYIESELAKFGIIPLRWAIVEVTEEICLVSVSYEK